MRGWVGEGRGVEKEGGGVGFCNYCWLNMMLDAGGGVEG